MFKKIGDLAKAENCRISLAFGQDGSLVVQVWAKSKDFTAISSDWSEKTIMEVIKDTIRRAKGK